MKLHEQALLYLGKAAADEALLDEVLASPRVADETIGFHCQQAAEKLLKALLSEHGVAFRRTPDLRELMDALTDAGHLLPPDLEDLDTLTPFGVFFRYEEWPAGAALDRGQARGMVRRLRAWVEAGVAPAAPGAAGC